MSGVDEGSLAKTGTIDMRATAPTISAARSACAPRTMRSSSSSGSDSRTSSAAISGRPCSRLVSRTYSSSVLPVMDTTTAVPART